MPVSSPRHDRPWFLGSVIVGCVIALSIVVLWTPATGAQEPTPEATATPTPTSTPAPTPTPVPAPMVAGTSGPVVFGAGTTTLGENFPAEERGDQVFVALHARMLPDQSIGGVFTVTHRKPNGELLVEVRGTISCLRVEGDHALVSGVITDARTPGLPDAALHAGLTAGIIIRDGGARGDRMAWSFGEAGPACTDLPAVTIADVEHGNFVVRP